LKICLHVADHCVKVLSNSLILRCDGVYDLSKLYLLFLKIKYKITPRLKRFVYAFWTLLISRSPKSLRTSLPLAVRWEIIDKFFYELVNFCYKSWILDSYVLVEPFIWSPIFYIVSPSLTSSMNKTVIFYLSLAFWDINASEFDRYLFEAFRELISLNWISCCLLTYFNAYLKPTMSEEIMMVLSILGTSFMTKF